ncbi:hypothetical protein PIB30_032852 [Stylosanthes scabra]|uniref:Cystatin domain-containing protein n=1 Tax=Stylosanthes scabra TaxID=79078 RepID=A0ABU6RCF3_9FABA|nr:hypothetical protein [Stylosanthes scabra]
MMRTHCLIIILTAPFCALLATADPWPGSASLIFAVDLNVDSPEVIHIANFAVYEQNKRSNENLNLVRILSCREAVRILDNSYSLELLVHNGVQINRYMATVIERPNFRFTLRPFEYELASFELSLYPVP